MSDVIDPESQYVYVLQMFGQPKSVYTDKDSFVRYVKNTLDYYFPSSFTIYRLTLNSSASLGSMVYVDLDAFIREG